MTEQLKQERRKFLLEDWPKFIESFPGAPGYEGEGPFEQRAVAMVARAIELEVSITGAPMTEEDVELAKRRPVKDFLNYLRSVYNRNNLINEYRITRDMFALEEE